MCADRGYRVAVHGALSAWPFRPGAWNRSVGLPVAGLCGVDDRPLPAIPARSGQHRYRGPAPTPCDQRGLASKADAGVRARGRARIGDRAGSLTTTPEESLASHLVTW